VTARRAIKQIDSGPDPRGTLPPRWRCAGEVPLRPARR
jgi:hypothetical protein